MCVWAGGGLVTVVGGRNPPRFFFVYFIVVLARRWGRPLVLCVQHDELILIAALCAALCAAYSIPSWGGGTPSDEIVD